MAASTRADLIGNRYGHLPWRKRVINYSTASTATYSLSPRESGAIFVCPTVSTIHFALPRISSKNLGLNFEFYFSSADAVLDYNIASTIDSSAHILINGYTSAASTLSAVSPLSSVGGNHCKVTAISSVAWLLENAYGGGFSSANSSDLSSVDAILGQWGVGTTQS